MMNQAKRLMKHPSYIPIKLPKLFVSLLNNARTFQNPFRQAQIEDTLLERIQSYWTEHSGMT